MGAQVCAVTDCDRLHYARGYCSMHYKRLVAHGDAETVLTPLGLPRSTSCGVDGCAEPVLARGWCSTHWQRWYKNGGPETTRGRPDQRGEKNPSWRGAEIGYKGVHCRLVRARGRAKDYPCADCGSAAQAWSYDHQDPQERKEVQRGYLVPYSLDLEHYQPRCKPCHFRKDGNGWGTTRSRKVG